MPGQSFLYDFEDDAPAEKGGGDGCPHPEDRCWEYETGARHTDSRERRVYCDACASIVEREAVPDGGGRA